MKNCHSERTGCHPERSEGSARSLVRLAILSFAIAACAHQPPSTMSSSGPSGGELSRDEQIRQTLNRLTFGARPGDAAAVRAMGVDQWINLQLSPAKISDASLDAVLAGMETQH